jgi:hypothetical protein
MTRLILHIDRLVLNGVRPEDRTAVAEALRAELQRQLASPQAVRRFISAGGAPRLDVGEVRLAIGAMPAEVGAAVAQGIAREVKP